MIPRTLNNHSPIQIKQQLPHLDRHGAAACCKPSLNINYLFYHVQKFPVYIPTGTLVSSDSSLSLILSAPLHLHLRVYI